TKGRMRIGPRTEHCTIQNLAGIMRRHGVERGLAGGHDAFRQRIARPVPEQLLPFLSRAHRLLLRWRELNRVYPGIGSRDVAVLESAGGGGIVKRSGEANRCEVKSNGGEECHRES